MNVALARNWWSLVIRGLVAICVGVIAFVWPGITLAALVLLFGAYALIDGIVSLAGAVKAVRSHERWLVLVLEGIVGIAAAAITVFWPGVTAFALIWIISFWAFVTGIFEIAAAIRLRKHFAGEWLLALSGVVSIIFGFLIIVFPLAGALAIAYMVGAYAFVFGILLVALGFRLRNWGHFAGSSPSPTAMPAR